nr:phospholipase-like protein [Tanacetum cinerariifolium]
MGSRLLVGSLVDKLEIDIIKAGNDLLNLPSKSAKIITILLEFFEVVLTWFEKESGYCGNMAKVLNKLTYLTEFFLRSRFLSSSSAIALDMENILSMIIEKHEELAHVLQALVIKCLKRDNQIASPVCWQFGKKALMICAAKLKLHLPDMAQDMSIAVYDYPEMVAHICETASEDNVTVYVTL